MRSNIEFEQNMKTIRNTKDVSLLLQKGMPIDYKDSNGNTLLMNVVKEMALLSLSNTNYTSIVSQLISLGADLNVRNLKGKTALGLAFSDSSFSMLTDMPNTREKVLIRGPRPRELEEIDEFLCEQLESYHAKETPVVIKILLSHGAFFTKEEGESFYNKLLLINLTNYDDTYFCLRMIESRFVYSGLHDCLKNIEMVFSVQRAPIYLAIMMASAFPEAIAKTISEYIDPIEKNYLMKADIKKIFPLAKQLCTYDISAILQKGLFRPIAVISNDDIAATEELAAVSPSTDCHIS